MILDNALSEETFIKVRDAIMDIEVPWYYSATAYNDEAGLYSYSFSHLVYLDGAIKSPLARTLWPVVKELITKAGHEMNELLRIRIGLVPVTETAYKHEPHVDYQFEHKTGLLYLNDCNGPTTIFNEKYNEKIGELRGDKAKALTIKEEILPKANRALFFDGLHYHGSCTPTDIPRRLVVNFNYTIKG